ncbi:MAG: beta-glucosidase, partial [Janthinobacterium lividum]
MLITTSLKTAFFFALFAILGAGFVRADPPPAGTLIPGAIYASPAASIEDRVNDLVGRLTQPEKLSLLALDSNNDPLKLDLPAIPRLGIPTLRTIDAPQGLRDGPASAFPMEVVMASTWDPLLIQQVGAAIGQEAKAKNRQIVYGPCVNIQRTPQDGRYFENFSEDPMLNTQMAVAYVNGMQSQGVAACIKHFACNNQENNRHGVSAVVDERTLHEIYFAAFQAAVQKAHVWSLMPALNQVNGAFCAQSKPLLTDLLRTQWGWDGLAVGDWGSMHATADCMNAGTDVEMPTPGIYSPAALTSALDSKQITQFQIDTAVTRVVRLMVHTGMLDAPITPNLTVVNSPAHQALTRKVALEGITLLKNENGLLPLNRKTLKSIAVIGPNAQDTQLGGRWSADVTPFYQVSIFDGIQKKVGSAVKVSFEQGCPRTRPGTPDAIAKAVALAASSDIAIVVVGTDNNYEGEEMDPPDLQLPGDQEKLIQAVAAANKHTLVILNCGTPLLTNSWLPRVSGLLETWYSGQEAGNAAADILFGDVSPSGKLAGTWAVQRQDYSDWGNYPGADNVVRYLEGPYVGYRHFDKAQIKPLFPFGFGLSYTTFGYSHLVMPSVLRIGSATTVHLTVQNTGKLAGDEIVQLYVRPLLPSIGRPVKELKAFGRVSLQPGQKKLVTLTLAPDAFAYWDIKTHGFKTDPGAYALDIGSSSRDIRLTGVL